MRAWATSVCLWIAAVMLAIGVGGNLFQAMVIDPVWSASPPESVRAFATATPYYGRLQMFHSSPILGLGLLCLLAAPFLAWNRPELRRWTLISATCYIVVGIVTFAYFHPLNRLLFETAATDPGSLARIARHWIIADRLRYGLRLAAFLSILKAMVVSGSSPPGLSRDFRPRAASDPTVAGSALR